MLKTPRRPTMPGGRGAAFYQHGAACPACARSSCSPSPFLIADWPVRFGFHAPVENFLRSPGILTAGASGPLQWKRKEGTRMDQKYRDTHHEDQNAVTEVGVPDPHQPGCRPPRAQELVNEADAYYAHAGATEPGGGPAPSRKGNQDRTAQPLGPDQAGPDQCGCGCPNEPGE